MTFRRFVSWLAKKRLFKLRYLLLYSILLSFFLSVHYWNGRVVTASENGVVNYFDGERNYFYISDSELHDDTPSSGGHDVRIHSAYYDSRGSGGGESLVRIFAYVYSLTNAVFCCFQVSGYYTWICTKKVAQRKVLSAKGFPNRSSGSGEPLEVMFSCAVNETDFGGLRLTKIMLIGVRNHVVGKLSKSHRILYPGSRIRSTKGTRFTVCVLPGGPKQKRRFTTSQDLFEYFELLKLLGTGRVISYYGDRTVTTVLRRVKDVSQETVVVTSGDVTGSSPLATNDCLYRSLNSADYVIFLDVNELLVPNATRDWAAMIASLQSVHNTTKVGAYVLPVFNFFDETTNGTASDRIGLKGPSRGGGASRLKHLPRIVRFRARESKTAPDNAVLGQPVKIDHITGSGSIKMLSGYINVNVPVDYAAVHRFIHDRHIYKGLVIDASKDKFVPLLMRKLYSLGNIVH